MELSHHLDPLKAASEVHFADYLRSAERLRAEWEVLREAQEAGQLHRVALARTNAFWQCVREVDASRTGCILATAAWVEGFANLVLTLRMSGPEFEAVERLGILEKWAVIIPLVVRGFTIPREGKVFQALRELIHDRNALTHPKPTASKDGILVHKGKALKYSIGREEDVLEKLRTWVGLPRMLLDMFREVDNELWNTLWVFSGYLNDDMRADSGLPELLNALGMDRSAESTGPTQASST